MESSPKRLEMMTRETVDKCVSLVTNSPSVHTVDITGGAPELCDQFRHLVSELRKIPGRDNLTIIDRCNLTALLEPGEWHTVR